MSGQCGKGGSVKAESTIKTYKLNGSCTPFDSVLVDYADNECVTSLCFTTCASGVDVLFIPSNLFFAIRELLNQEKTS